MRKMHLVEMIKISIKTFIFKERADYFLHSLS